MINSHLRLIRQPAIKDDAERPKPMGAGPANLSCRAITGYHCHQVLRRIDAADLGAQRAGGSGGMSIWLLRIGGLSRRGR
jgi:hypothetical protein